MILQTSKKNIWFKKMNSKTHSYQSDVHELLARRWWDSSMYSDRRWHIARPLGRHTWRFYSPPDPRLQRHEHTGWNVAAWSCPCRTPSRRQWWSLTASQLKGEKLSWNVGLLQFQANDMINLVSFKSWRNTRLCANEAIEKILFCFIIF